MVKFFSYCIAIFLGLLAIAPPIGYNIPLNYHSGLWVYASVASGLFGVFLCFQDIPKVLKFMIVFLYLDCFVSQCPAEGFNAYILIVAVLYVFFLFKKLDYKIIINMVQAIFWFQVLVLLVQVCGQDTLMEWGSTVRMDALGKLDFVNDPSVRQRIFFGTVFQSMRLGSLFCTMAPFLLVKSRWYFVPLFILAVCADSLSFTLALLVGGFSYLVMTKNAFLSQKRVWLAAGVLLAVVAYRCRTHIYVEIVEGRIPVWWVILKTWVLDTTGPLVKSGTHMVQWGPFDGMRFLFGHGLDSFLGTFRYYKHDPNPFPQAHNDWLQIPWEIGLVGAALVYTFVGQLYYELFETQEWVLIAGLNIIAVAMFFTFPTRMTQSVFLLVAFVAYCTKRSLDARINASRCI